MLDFPEPKVGDSVEVKHGGEYRYGDVTRVNPAQRRFWLVFPGNEWDNGPFSFDQIAG